MPIARAALTLAALGLLVCPLWEAAAREPAPAEAPPIDLAPHRAVYDMELERADPNSGIVGMEGRLVFEILGSACTGYSVNMRFVSSIHSQDDTTTSDLRSTSYEEGDGSSYRFVSRSFFDGTLTETADGMAARSEQNVTVDLDLPESLQFSLGEGVMFPTQHLRAVLEAAQEGRSLLEARVYDGSDGGQKVYDATAIIGNAGRPDKLPQGADAEALSGLPAWPVVIAYFDDEPAPAVTPSYEFSYDIFANGVSSRIELDYGTFAIGGGLVSLDFVEPTPC